jgi:hypothetical protein
MRSTEGFPIVCEPGLRDSMSAERDGIYIGLENIADDPCLMGSVPLREVEVSKKRMLGTAIYEIVPVRSTRSAF